MSGPTLFPVFTIAAAIVLAVLQMLLMLYAANGRGQFRVGLGDGGNQKLLTRIRMHGNLAENTPLFLILLFLTEVSGKWPLFVPWIALAFVVARILHPIGLAIGQGANPPRFLGVIGTLASVLALCTLLGISLFTDSAWLQLKLM